MQREADKKQNSSEQITFNIFELQPKRERREGAPGRVLARDGCIIDACCMIEKAVETRARRGFRP